MTTASHASKSRPVLSSRGRGYLSLCHAVSAARSYAPLRRSKMGNPKCHGWGNFIQTPYPTPALLRISGVTVSEEAARCGFMT